MAIIDLHCDTISYLSKQDISLYTNTGQYDIKRALEADICLQFFALFVMPGDFDSNLRIILKQLDKFYRELENNAEYLYHFKTYNDFAIERSTGKIACLLHLEGAECLGNDTEILRILYRLGLRSMGLTWNNRNLLADGVGEGEIAGGISKKGREIIKEMSRLGIILDLAHISEKAYFEAFDIYDKEILVTHANVRALCENRRNLSDKQLKVLADHGGIIGITQVADFVNKDNATIDKMLDHICYVADLVGVKHVALGSDFDGADNMVISDVGAYKDMPDLLMKRGFDKNEVEMILSENVLSFLEKIL